LERKLAALSDFQNALALLEEGSILLRKLSLYASLIQNRVDANPLDMLEHKGSLNSLLKEIIDEMAFSHRMESTLRQFPLRFGILFKYDFSSSEYLSLLACSLAYKKGIDAAVNNMVTGESFKGFDTGNSLEYGQLLMIVLKKLQAEIKVPQND
jgi:hypothetical protein